MAGRLLPGLEPARGGRCALRARHARRVLGSALCARRGAARPPRPAGAAPRAAPRRLARLTRIPLALAAPIRALGSRARRAGDEARGEPLGRVPPARGRELAGVGARAVHASREPGRRRARPCLDLRRADGNSLVQGSAPPVSVSLGAGEHTLTLARGGFTLAPGNGGAAVVSAIFLTRAHADRGHAAERRCRACAAVVRGALRLGGAVDAGASGSAPPRAEAGRRSAGGGDGDERSAARCKRHRRDAAFDAHRRLSARSLPGAVRAHRGPAERDAAGGGQAWER